jgi:hypothetical protein
MIPREQKDSKIYFNNEFEDTETTTSEADVEDNTSNYYPLTDEDSESDQGFDVLSFDIEFNDGDPVIPPPDTVKIDDFDPAVAAECEQIVCNTILAEVPQVHKSFEQD